MFLLTQMRGVSRSRPVAPAAAQQGKYIRVRFIK